MDDVVDRPVEVVDRQVIAAIDAVEEHALFYAQMDRYSWTLIVFAGTLGVLMAVLSAICIVLIVLFSCCAPSGLV